MKRYLLFLALSLTFALQAQAPQGFNYQASVRNSAGDLIVNTNLYFKFNVMQGSQTSLPVFTEIHYVPTDDLGQVNLVIGQGTATTGAFSELDWSLGSFYLGIELDTGSGYVAMGTTQLLSVPYALYAENSGNSTPTTPNLEAVLAENNSANNQQIKDLQDPTEAQDATTKAYVDIEVINNVQNIEQVLIQGNYSNGLQLKGIADPTDAQDAVTKAYIDSLIANLQSQIDEAIACSELQFNQPNDLAMCDNDSEGYVSFDLEIQTTIILGTQDPSTFTVTYHATPTDADNNTAALSSPFINTVAYGQPIYVRVEEAGLPNCYETTEFDLLIDPLPTTTTMTPLSECHDDADGTTQFMLTDKDTEALGGQSGVVVSYHATLTDAEAGSAPLSSPFTSTSQQIFVRLTSATNCYSTMPLDLVIYPLPYVDNQAVEVLSDEALGINFGSSSSVSDLNYEITSLTLNGLTVSAGGAGLGGGLSASDLSDDAFSNTTSSPIDVVYIVVPYSSSGCMGSPFTVTVTVNPAFVTDIDGNTYDILTYGNQVWTVENAEMVTYRDGTPIPQVTDETEWENLTTGAWCYYDNDPTKPRLYNWYAVMGIYDSDSLTYAALRKEFAPEGWHVPSDAEWTTLEYYLIANGYNYDGTNFSNKIAKSMASRTGWYPSAITGAVGNDQSLNNSSGFNAFPVGNHFGGEGTSTYFWSSTQNSPTYGAMSRMLRSGESELSSPSSLERNGLSVRFVRD